MSTVVVGGRMPRHLTLENLALRQSLARSPRSGHGKRQPDSTTERGVPPDWRQKRVYRDLVCLAA